VVNHFDGRISDDSAFGINPDAPLQESYVHGTGSVKK